MLDVIDVPGCGIDAKPQPSKGKGERISYPVLFMYTTVKSHTSQFTLLKSNYRNLYPRSGVRGRTR